MKNTGASVRNILVIALGLACGSAPSVRANFGYRIEADDTVTITNYTGADTYITIPDEIDGYTVAAIGNRVFQSKPLLTGIAIADTVTAIGEWAFASCSALTNMTIPNSVATIGQRAFSSCTKLTEVFIGEGLTELGAGVFWYCYSLTNISVSANNSAYSSLDGVLFNKDKSVLIQYPLGKPSAYNVPASVITIGEHAFFSSDSVTEVAIPSSVNAIRTNAFRSCNSLTNISVSPDNLVYSSLNGVLFSKDGTTLVQYPGGLEGSYTIPSSVVAIAGSAFFSSPKLTSVTIGSDVTSIGVGAFGNCDSLTNISVSIDNLLYSSLDGVLFNKQQTSLVQYPSGRNGSYSVPDGVSFISNGAFENSDDLIQVVIPASVTNISFAAFRFCVNLTAVLFKGDAPSLNQQVFTGSNWAIIYHLAGASGWEGTTFGGRPTAIWPEIINIPSKPSSLTLSIVASAGQRVVVEASTCLFGSTWAPVSTNIIEHGLQDILIPDAGSDEIRLYRVVLQ